MKLKKSKVLEDLKLAIKSRYLSIAGRREVLNGRAKFGVFSDGKELAQIAMANVTQNGDFITGYYRDQTTALKLGAITPVQFFSQLYAHSDINFEPSSAARGMPNHISTRLHSERDKNHSHLERVNFCSDISAIAGQFPKALGLAFASKKYKNQPQSPFSNRGKEVVFASTGDGGTSEGIFFETVNAAAVLGVPLIIPIWDDGYAISVTQEYQTPKKNLSDVFEGFVKNNDEEKGIYLLKTKGHDYFDLTKTFHEAATKAREQHIPVIVHVQECTQPLGHSTSGSHEKYKSAERLDWEKKYDCVEVFKNWCIENQVVTQEQLKTIEKEVKKEISDAQKQAITAYVQQFEQPQKELEEVLKTLSGEQQKIYLEAFSKTQKTANPSFRKLLVVSKKIQREIDNPSIELDKWVKKMEQELENRYDSFVYSVNQKVLKELPYEKIKLTKELVDGREIIRDSFDTFLEAIPELYIFGQDCGKIGDVNHGLEGLQKKYGESRVFDCGVREVTIIGQGTGMAMRGLKPIAEVQYLDYLVYALQHITDDISSLFYRTAGKQKAPVIIRTRGHRLEGIWHSGSPIGMILNAIRGMYFAVPRNFTQAAGIYNTLLKSENPAIVIEPLIKYRDKEYRPKNIGEYYVELGKPEILAEGKDVTIVTYGPCCDIAIEVAENLRKKDISLEVIDVQTLIPFDTHNIINTSLKKTNRIIFMDEDVPGGASAYMFERAFSKKVFFENLDAKPVFVSAKEHRPAYGSDGDYVSKPTEDTLYNAVFEVLGY